MAALGLAVDALTWILPHCVVWSLQLRRAHKIAITAIFATGILCDSTRTGIRVTAPLTSSQQYHNWCIPYSGLNNCGLW